MRCMTARSRQWVPDTCGAGCTDPSTIRRSSKRDSMPSTCYVRTTGLSRCVRRLRTSLTWNGFCRGWHWDRRDPAILVDLDKALRNYRSSAAAYPRAQPCSMNSAQHCPTTPH